MPPPESAPEMSSLDDIIKQTLYLPEELLLPEQPPPPPPQPSSGVRRSSWPRWRG